MSHYATAFSSVVGIAMGTSLVFLGSISAAALRQSPSEAHEYFANSTGLAILTEEQLASFRRDGIIVIDNVLSNAELKRARDDVFLMLDDKQSQFSINDNEDTSVRSDVVQWISETVCSEHRVSVNPGLLHALRCVRSIPHELQDCGITGSKLGVPFVNQLACYDGNGAKYIPHRDKPEDSHPLRWLLQPGLDDREVTIILYLNDSVWDSSAGGLQSGGNLRCYMNADKDDITGTSASHIIDIVPHGGRMVIFNSAAILHEVCPSYQRRIALTCWVGGSHSQHQWLRPFCIPRKNINWGTLWKRVWA